MAGIHTFLPKRTPAPQSWPHKLVREPLNWGPKATGKRDKLNRTFSKEASTLSCLQKDLCIPFHMSFSFFIPGTFYILPFFPFFRSYPLDFLWLPITNQMCSMHTAVLTSEMISWELLPKQARLSRKAQPANRSASGLHNLQDKLKGGTASRCTHRKN